MKINLKRISKRTLSVILAIMTMVSTMLIGTFTADAAISYWSLCYSGNGWASDDDTYKTDGADGSITYDNGDGTYSSSNPFYFRVVAHEGTSAVHNNVNNTTTLVEDDTGYQLTWNCNTAYSIQVNPTKRYITINIYSDGTYNYVKVTQSDDDPSGDISADLLSVLKGEKVMFYAGEPVGWNQEYFTVGTVSNSTTTSINSSYRLATFCLPSEKYKMGHENYVNFTLTENAKAGATYILQSKNTSTGFTVVSNEQDGNCVHSYNNGATTTATTACDDTITVGNSLSVSTTSSAGTSTVEKSNTFKYYIGDSDGNYAEYTLSDGTLDTSALAAGTYTLKTVLYDGNIYVVGDTDTFTVSSVVVDPKDVTPVFSDGKGSTDSKSVATNTALNLDVTATLPDVTDAYTLTYLTECSSANVTITGAGTATPVFTASAAGTYTVTTTVTNDANTALTAKRTTTVTVSDTVVSDYKVVLYNSTEIDMTKVKDGLYVSSETVEYDTDKTKYFTIYNTADSTYAIGNSSDHHWIKDDVTTAPVVNWVASYPTTGNYLNKYTSAKYVVYDSSSAVIYLVDSIDELTNSTVYAKYGEFGTTKVEETPSVTYSKDGTNCKIYKAASGSTVKLTTTVTESDRFVYAYVINGKDYVLAAQNPLNESEYTAEFIVKEIGANYEVTPIYYVNDCKDGSDNYITFYVDAGELGNRWGNTIACYGYYYYSGTKALASDGSYPGQPMLYDKEQNMYFARLPKTMSGTVDGTSYSNMSVSGVTINNFVNDTIHASLMSDTANRQSYDFNDFKYINDLGMDMAIFDIKLRTSTTMNYSVSDSTFSYDTFKNINGWDKFTDVDGNNTDILGGEIDASNTKKLYIVSRASYEDTSSVGEFATRWYVYNQANELVTYGHPSDFIPRPDGTADTDQITAIKNGGYVGAAVEITYESVKTYKDAQGAINAYRLDGRWYYTSSDTEVTANVKYQLENADGTWGDILEDVNIASINGATSATFKRSSVNGSLMANSAQAGSDYVFYCWGIIDDYGEVQETDNTSSAMSITQLAKDTTYVAMFRKAEAGTLYLSHNMYPGGGLGYYYLSAVMDGVTYNGTVSGNGQTLNIPVTETSGDITITLTTVTAGDNTFENWYQASSAEPYIIGDSENGTITVNGTVLGDEEEIPANTQGTLSYTFTITTSKLFNDSGLIVTSFDWYSKISSVSRNCVLTYKYIDRFGSEKTYVRTIELDAQYYSDNGNSWLPNDTLIAENAPAIDDLYKDCSWIIADSVKNGSEVTLVANQNTKCHNVTITDADGVETPVSNVSYNDYLYNSNGELFVAPETNENGDAFSYWLVQVLSYSSPREVAKCYNREFNLRILDDYIVTAMYGVEKESSVTIADPNYSHEVYTDDSGSVVYDYLYADFVVAYMNADGTMLNGNESYQTGLIIEMDTSEKITDSEKESGFVPSNHTGMTEPTSEQLLNAVTTVNHGKYTKLDNSSTYLYNYIINDGSYNNWNRLNYIIKFANTANWQNRVMKAYYYVYNTETGELTVSDPVYFNLYEYAQIEAYIVEVS